MYSILFRLCFALCVAFCLCGGPVAAAVSDTSRLTSWVDPFIGTTNYGATHPGALCPNGMMAVIPFNVTGAEGNRYDKDARWWSAPYERRNRVFVGYAHVGLSGVGCPDMSSLLLMPTSGPLNVDQATYGSGYVDEYARPGYYRNRLAKYGITTEVTATPRVGAARFTFPAGTGHILLNLGDGLTNESGAAVRRVSDTEVEGMKLLGNFCYLNPDAVYPIYFALRVSKKPSGSGAWKRQRPMTVEAQWDSTAGRLKLYRGFKAPLAGDDIGYFFSFDTKEGEQVEVRLGVSFVDQAGAWRNLEAEAGDAAFDELRTAADREWETALSRIRVSGGTAAQRTVFYTALYHTLIHPNILQDVDGRYPLMNGQGIGHTAGTRYTVFSLWDTYRNLHPLLTLAYPERQLEMVRSMLGIYRESGWLPRWELYGREAYVMEGDPAIPVIVDTWMKGLRDFDAGLAYEAMRKGAFTPGRDNPLRPDNDWYLERGYVPLVHETDNSVSHALEYSVADYALSLMADSLGHKADARTLRERALGYRQYYCPEFGLLRPRCVDGTFYSPFDPKLGADFAPNPGFHEGNAYSYTFSAAFDAEGLARMMGGADAYMEKLDSIFECGNYDPTNEPDIVYPYLYSRFKGHARRTQELTQALLARYFTTGPDGLPGNDDTGTMSAWAVFSMMGFYPDTPGVPVYTLTTPVFDRIEIALDRRWYRRDRLVIDVDRQPGGRFLRRVELGGRKADGFRIAHEDWVNAGHVRLTVGR